MNRKELPVGLQAFHKIRKEEGAYYYVDKTDYAYQLASKEGHFFLSRPRRFGKSLFVDTLQELFEGKEKLFRGYTSTTSGTGMWSTRCCGWISVGANSRNPAT